MNQPTEGVVQHRKAWPGRSSADPVQPYPDYGDTAAPARTSARLRQARDPRGEARCGTNAEREEGGGRGSGASSLLCALLSLGGLLATEGQASAQSEAATGVAAVTSTIKLFDGTSLNGLYVWSQEHGFSDPKGVFKVEDGLLHVSGDQPYVGLSTEKEYANYQLILEFKWGTRTFGERTGKARDAGLLLHAKGADGGWRGRLMANIEAQIMEGSMGDLILLKGSRSMSMTVPVAQVRAAGTTNWNYRGGYRWAADGRGRTFTTDLDTVHWSKWDPAWRDVAGFRGANDLEKPLGEWNQMVVVANGDRLEVFFNGEKVNEATRVFPSSGKIQLESEQAEYYVRRWELRPLGSTGESTSTAPAGPVSNLSVRARAGEGEKTLIMGFVVGGSNSSESRALLVRGVGPSLAPFGVTDALLDPALLVYGGTTVLASNDNWNGNATVSSVAARTGAEPFTSTSSKDAALVRAFTPGAYTVHITGADGGVALAELFDATIPGTVTGANAGLINASSRCFVGSGEDVLIVGFVVGGTMARPVMIRAVGPTLRSHGIAGVLENPQLELFAGGTLLLRNDDWGAASNAAEIATTAAAVGAFALPASSRDAVILAALPPGAYTAHVTGVAGATGVVLAEIYAVR